MPPLNITLTFAIRSSCMVRDGGEAATSAPAAPRRLRSDGKRPAMPPCTDVLGVPTSNCVFAALLEPPLGGSLERHAPIALPASGPGDAPRA